MKTTFLIPRFALSFLPFGQKVKDFEVRQENGGALIETALALPLLALLLLGASELGLADYAAIEVANAAKAGAQYGTQNARTAADITGIGIAAQNDAPNIALGPTTVSTTPVCSNPAATLPACTGASIETILTVQTQYPFKFPAFIPGLTPSFTLHGQAVQMVMQ